MYMTKRHVLQIPFLPQPSKEVSLSRVLPETHKHTLIIPFETEHIIKYTLGLASSVVVEVSQITRESRAKATQTINATTYI